MKKNELDRLNSKIQQKSIKNRLKIDQKRCSDGPDVCPRFSTCFVVLLAKRKIQKSVKKTRNFQSKSCLAALRDLSFFVLFRHRFFVVFWDAFFPFIDRKIVPKWTLTLWTGTPWDPPGTPRDQKRSWIQSEIQKTAVNTIRNKKNIPAKP